MAGLGPLPDQHCDGLSFAPLLRGDTDFERGPIFWNYPHYGNQGGTPGSSVRLGDYKLIEFFEDGRLELFILAEDLSEEHNLADVEPETATTRHRLLVQWRERVEAKIPQPKPGYVPGTDSAG